MSPTSYRDDIVPQDVAEDDSSLETGAGLPLSEAEIQDLLYGDSRSVDERLTLLRQLRDELGERGDADFGDDDPGALINEINERIAELEGDETLGEAADTLDVDPLAHRETLAPDSDELEELDEEEEASLDEEDEWLDDEEDEGQEER